MSAEQMDTDASGLLRVVVCDISDDADNQDAFYELRQKVEEIPGIALYNDIRVGDSIPDYLEIALQTNDVVVIRVPEIYRHIVGVVSQALQWQEKSNSKKVIPVYDTREQCAKSKEEFFKNGALFMKDDDFEAKLKKALTEGQKIEHHYPMGDASSGLAINYLTPLNILVCDKFDEIFDKAYKELKEKRKDVSLIKVSKVILAIPNQCTTPKKLHEYQGLNNAQILTLPAFSMHGVNRPFTICMAEIQDHDKVYVVRIEVPNIVTTLSRMSDLDDKTAIPNVKKLTEEQMKMQRDAFFNTTKDLVEFSNSNRYKFVHFNENGTDLSRNVLEAIKEDEGGPSKQSEDTKARRPPVYVCYDIDEQDDEQDKIKDFQNMLREEGLTVLVRESHQSDFDILREKDNTDVIIATTFFWTTKGQLSKYQKKILDECLRHQDNRKFEQAIALIADDQAPDPAYVYLNNINNIKYCDARSPQRASFLRHVTDACTGKKPLAYPVGPVYHGLVWTTCLNYLRLALPGKLKNIRTNIETLKNTCQPGEEVIVFDKLILLVEKGCRDLGGKNFSELEGFESGREGAITSDDMAAIPRIFSQGVFKFTYQNKVYIASCEFIRAVTCLKEIKDTNLLPLTQSQMERQAAEFCRLFREAAHRNIPEINQNCELLFYDGDAPENKTGNGELQLNKILADFINAHST